MIRTYDRMLKFDTFVERYRYLRLMGSIGRDTFGFDRHVNQKFYRSREWQDVRNYVITRDEGLDLAFPDREIHSEVLVHHMNPMTLDDIVHSNAKILDPNYLITTTHRTHNAIHYGTEDNLLMPFEERVPDDTKLW